MRKRRFPQIVKPLVIVGLIILSLLVALRHVSGVLSNASYLKIKEVIIIKDDPVDISYLKGKNIFAIDLRRESRYILEAYPNYRRIRMVRIFPNRLYVGFVKRSPLAMVRLYRYFYVDEDLVLFDMPQQESIQDLPVIVGLETRIFSPRSGRKQEIKELALAVDIITEAGRNRNLKDYTIKKVDVSSPDSASFFMITPYGHTGSLATVLNPVPAVVEVKVGQGNIKSKMNVLAGLLAQLQKDVPDLKYIDLRFKEPVVKLSTAKEK